MSQSLSYYIILLVLKLKGIKKEFSKDPIDFKKIRKQDIHEPGGTFFKKNAKSFKVLDSRITEVKTNESSTKLVLFIHGGAYIAGPAQHHWDTIKVIVEQTSAIVWMCDYPKAPENGIQEIAKNINEVYRMASEKYGANQISIIGDSAGGSLVTSLVQRLIKTTTELPKQLILVSPVMDATLSNPEIAEVEKNDPMLSRVGVLSAKKMCAKDLDLSNALISPLNAQFEGFPKTTLFLATNDIMYPDQKLVVQKMNAAEIDLKVIEGNNMPHIWPFLPVMKEAKAALKKIILELN